MATTTSSYEGNDWLVVSDDDSSCECLAVSSPQMDATTWDNHSLETSFQLHHIIESDHHSEHTKKMFSDDIRQESDTEQTSAKTQDWNIFQLLVWHSKLESPIELLDETMKPIVVAASKRYSQKKLESQIQEMVHTLPQLRRVFPQVTRENVGKLIQVCERSHEKKWVPLERQTRTEELRCCEEPGKKEESKLQLMAKLDLHSEKEWHQLLIEGKLEVDVKDWRHGRFYSDVQKDAWRFQLQIGQLVDALDTDNRWYESRVVDISTSYVKVHYRGWTSKWDEWLNQTSARLAPLHTKVPDWRAFQVGDEILVGSEVPRKQYPEWRIAYVTACDIEEGSLQIEVSVDGKKKWLDAQDELLCAKGTHKAVNASLSTDSGVFPAPLSLLINYFERPGELLSMRPSDDALAKKVVSMRDATHVIHSDDNDVDGDEWCVVDDCDDKDGKAVAHKTP